MQGLTDRQTKWRKEVGFKPKAISHFSWQKRNICGLLIQPFRMTVMINSCPRVQET